MSSFNQIAISHSNFEFNSLKRRSFSFDNDTAANMKVNEDLFYEDILYSSSFLNPSYKISPIIDVDKLKSNAWKGIPFRYRPQVWRIFLDYEPSNRAISQSVLQHKRSDYFVCLGRIFDESQRHLWTNSQQQTQIQILKDLPRTNVQLIRKEPRVKLLFERVLFIWAYRHPASGYVQGMNDILLPFFYVFLSEKLMMKEQKFDIDFIENLATLEGLTEDDLNDIEADCFWCFSKLLDSIQDLFTKDQPGIYKMLNNLEIVVNRVAPVLSQTIKDEEIQYQEFAFRWMNCLLVREFKLNLVLRLWDNYVCFLQKMNKLHVYICAAYLELLLQPLLKGLNHTDFIIKIQDPFDQQNSSSSCVSSISNPSLTVSPLASDFNANSSSSSKDLEKKFSFKRFKRNKQKGIRSSCSSSDLSLDDSLNLNRNKVSWDEKDMDMIIAQAFIYEKMFQSSAHLK